MAKILALANQKGGVGKTTSCVNLAASLVVAGQRVLLVDLDPQGNATMGSGVDKNTPEHTTCDVLTGDASIEVAIIKSTPAGFDVLAANSDLTAAEVVLLRKQQQQGVLAQALQQVAAQYDFILIDCPPSLNMLTLNALVAADAVMTPMQCEYYALEGLSALMATISQIRNTVNPKLEIEGVLRTMYDGRNRLAIEVSEQLVSHFGNKVYQTVIPRNVRLAEAPSHGLPGLIYDSSSRGAIAYLELASEVLGKKSKPAEKTPPSSRRMTRDRRVSSTLDE